MIRKLSLWNIFVCLLDCAALALGMVQSPSFVLYFVSMLYFEIFFYIWLRDC